jgi:hypothetical protein
MEKRSPTYPLFKYKVVYEPSILALFKISFFRVPKLRVHVIFPSELII